METLQDWLKLKIVLAVKAIRSINGSDKVKAIRDFLSSLVDDPSILAQTIHRHGSIENSLHWVLDMTFREDNCQICDPTAVRNFALLHNIAINLVTGPFLKPVYKVNARRPPGMTATCSNSLKSILCVSPGSFAFKLGLAPFPEGIQALLIVVTVVHDAPEPLNSFEQFRCDRPCTGKQPQFLLHHRNAQG